jgi:hypothetical protein
MKPYTMGELMGISDCRFKALVAAAEAEKMHHEAREVTTVSEQMEILGFEEVYRRIKQEQQRRGM